MERMVEIKNISKRFGNREIFKNFSVDIGAGEFVSIIGPSGCGKSTLLNMIGLLESVDSGSILIGGKKLPGLNGRKATSLRRNTINYLFQSYALINDLTVMQNVQLAMNFMNVSQKEKLKRAESVLERLEIGQLANEKVSVLSGGEQQRVSIARTVLKPGDLILADEPTGALDENTANQVFSLIKNLSTEYNKTIIMVTHNPLLAQRTDRVIALTGNVE